MVYINILLYNDYLPMNKEAAATVLFRSIDKHYATIITTVSAHIMIRQAVERAM